MPRASIDMCVTVRDADVPPFASRVALPCCSGSNDWLCSVSCCCGASELGPVGCSHIRTQSQ